MGIETRKGKLYYYRKRRIGNRVVSEYQGGGLLVDLAARRAEIERREREALQEQLKAARMSMADIDAQLDGLDALTDGLVVKALTAAGFHQHKRQWRRKRNANIQKD